MFYTYRQNLSGGRFDFFPERGISHLVVIEADSAEAADAKAEGLGIYFQGTQADIDCDCCGDRWYPAGLWVLIDPATDEPMFDGYAIDFTAPYPKRSPLTIKWIDGPEGYCHYADGTVVPFYETASEGQVDLSRYLASGWCLTGWHQACCRDTCTCPCHNHTDEGTK